MKRKFLSIFLVVLVSTTITACKAKEVSSPVKQDVSTAQKTSEVKNPPESKEVVSPQKTPEVAKTTETTKKATVTTQVTKQPEQKELFYGDWVVKKSIAFGPVSTYSNDDVNKIIGKKLSYSELKAVFETNSAQKPFYKKISISKGDFETSNKIKLSTLGITSSSINQVTVYIDSSSKNMWNSMGSIFYVKDQNTLILFDGGVYFELDKVVK